MSASSPAAPAGSLAALRPYLVPSYFALGGLAGGLLFLGGVATLVPLPHAGPLTGLRDGLCLPLILACAVILTLDLTHPLRFFRLLLTFRPSSPVSWGSYILTFAGAAAAMFEAKHLVGYRWIGGPAAAVAGAVAQVPALAAGMCSAVLGFGLAGYTGILLTASSRVRWFASPWLGGVFFGCGCATAAALGAAAGGDAGARARVLLALACGGLALALLRTHLERIEHEALAGRVEEPVPLLSGRWLARGMVAAAAALVLALPALIWRQTALRAAFALAVAAADVCVRFAVFWLEEGPPVDPAEAAAARKARSCEH